MMRLNETALSLSPGDVVLVVANGLICRPPLLGVREGCPFVEFDAVDREPWRKVFRKFKPDMELDRAALLINLSENQTYTFLGLSPNVAFEVSDQSTKYGIRCYYVRALRGSNKVAKTRSPDA